MMQSKLLIATKRLLMPKISKYCILFFGLLIFYNCNENNENDEEVIKGINTKNGVYYIYHPELKVERDKVASPRILLKGHRYTADKVYLETISLSDDIKLTQASQKNKDHLQEFMKDIYTKYGTSIHQAQRSILIDMKDGLIYNIYVNGSIIGQLGVHTFNAYKPNVGEFFYWIDKEFLRKGIMSSATKEVLHVLKEKHKLVGVNFAILKNNRASIQFAQKKFKGKELDIPGEGITYGSDLYGNDEWSNARLFYIDLKSF